MSDKIEKEEKPETVALTPAIAVAEKPKKQKRKFAWTEARRKAFAKCVEARKKGLQKEKSPKKSKKKILLLNLQIQILKMMMITMMTHCKN
jgi:hypothetical protein